MSALPSSFVEATNGILLIVLFWMILFCVLYLWQKLKQSCFAVVYVECKAAIALLVLLVGFETRTFVLWLLRHLQNAGVDTSPFREVAIFLLLAGSVGAIWGGMCWIKVITPLDHSRGTWVVLTAIAVIFGVGMAL